MKNNLTIQILTENNEKTIKDTLESLVRLNGQIMIVDLGSKDETLSICQYYGCEMQKAEHRHRSKLRNDLVQRSQSDWHFYIEPWEVLAYGADAVRNVVKGKKPESYFFQVFRGDNITKEVRLWHAEKKLEFCNPVYECLTDNGATSINSVLFAKNFRSPQIADDVQRWREDSPAAGEPYYYEACVLLGDGKYDEFLKTASVYMFRDNQKVMPITMIRYYCALVYCHYKKDPILAIQHLIPCIVAQPLMAEFWCLMGDIHYKLLREYEKAYAFYDNAIILGGKRSKIDQWPMEVKKYEDYPQDMKKACLQKLRRTTFLGKPVSG